MDAFAQSRFIFAGCFRTAAAAWLMASALSLAACATSARFETSGGGHPIFVTVADPHTVDSRETHARIATESAVVLVERARVRIAGNPWQAIPEHVPVHIHIARDDVSIRAGSVTMSRTIR